MSNASKEVQPRWTPRIGEPYFNISTISFEAILNEFKGYEYEKKHIAAGLAFKTRVEANKAADKLYKILCVTDLRSEDQKQEDYDGAD